MLVNNLNNPILITGVQRSGASIVARIINMSGVWIGETTEMFENKRINNLSCEIHKFLFSDSKGQYPLPRTKLTNLSFYGNLQSCLAGDGYKYETAWLYKNSKICQAWWIWNNVFPNAKWIIVRRRTGDIITSCMKTAYMTAFKDPIILKTIGVRTPQDGWLWWIHEHEKLFVEMIEAGLNCKVIWPDRMVSGDYDQVKEMVEWLGLKWNDSIVKIIDPLLNKKKGSI